MKTSMVFPIRFWALVLASLLVYQFSSEAAADSCKFEKKITITGRDDGCTGAEFSNYLVETVKRVDLNIIWESYQ